MATCRVAHVIGATFYVVVSEDVKGGREGGGGGRDEDGTVIREKD